MIRRSVAGAHKVACRPSVDFFIIRPSRLVPIPLLYHLGSCVAYSHCFVKATRALILDFARYQSYRRKIRRSGPPLRQTARLGPKLLATGRVLGRSSLYQAGLGYRCFR
jgi:hypothetical protein